MRGAAALVVAMVGLPLDALAGIYTCTDAQGRTVFRDAPCPKGERAGAHALDETARPRSDAPRARSKEKPAPTPLERAQVERLLARLDKAMGKRDPKAVVALFSKDAVVELDLGAGGPADPMRTPAFSRYLGTAFSRPAYVYRPAPPRISLSRTKPRATVTRSVREAVLVGGAVREMELRERLTVQQQGQRLLINRMRKTAPSASQGA